ncbi:helix-turn-helix domain-containing protein [Flavobacteriaceae bacterium AU392]|nr:AraC family transcriptional regulator [Flavobacteriaceae bacterium]RKM83566.1 helix-turn-helix domain-containing protein [Flavobacteriaceae bacterium AU392]
MNLETIILLLISGQGLLLSIGLITSIFKKKYSNLFLGIIILVITIEILNAVAMQFQYHSRDYPFPFWILGSYWLIPSALFFFLKLNTIKLYQLRPLVWLLFIPSIVEIMIESIAFYLNIYMSVNYKLIDYTFWFVFTEVMPLLSMIIVLIVYWIDLKRFKSKLKDVIIQQYKQHLFKLNIFFILFNVFTLLWFVQGVLNYQVFLIIEVLLATMLFAIGYIGYFQPSLLEVPKSLKTKVINNEFHHYNDTIELKRLELLFEIKNIYTKPKLSLKEVAQELKLPQRYVSILINSYHNTSFRNFVNMYRVNDFKQRVKDPKETHKTLLALALESGFNSKSSFNQIFKEFTGKNPSDFLNK